MSISSTIKSIQDIMRKDVGVDGDAQRIGQLVWLLFLKIFDDRELEWELMDDNYRSPIPESCRWRTWAADPEGMTGDALKDFIDNNLFPQLQNLHEYSNTPSAFVVRSVFEDAYNYMKSGQLLRQVINKIQQGVDFNRAQERHEFGNLYEQLLRDLQNAGNAGEFSGVWPCSLSQGQKVAIPAKLLLPEFEAYAWSFEVGAVKPEPAIYEHLLNRLGCKAPSIAMIGDTLEADVLGPERLGVHGFHLRRDAIRGPDRFASLIEFADHILGMGTVTRT